LCLSLYERPAAHEKPEDEEAAWLETMARTAAETLAVPRENVILKVRKRQRGAAQYEKVPSQNILGAGGEDGGRIVIREQGLRFLLDLGSHVDTGLFLDHRPLRARIRTEAAGKTVLNLFAYTGAFSVYAASGGAAQVTSVDLSNTYLETARRNFALNGLDAGAHDFVRSDALFFLADAAKAGRTWEVIILDPPTFSNSKKMPAPLDTNGAWPECIRRALDVLAPQGVLYFSTNSRRLKFDESLLAGGISRAISIEDISAKTIPEDFALHPKIHRTWRIAWK
jgi:23S rRNA (cytosine1962-C5)-methyltransferase